MSNELLVLLTAMIPVGELRASIPVGLASGLPLAETFILSVVGNMLPVPFLILFVRPVLTWLKRFTILEKVISRFELKTGEKADKIKTYVAWGLLTFVAIPLPGTGAWTGAFIAALLDLRLKLAVPVILGGVVGAGIIVSLVSTGIIHIFS